MSNYTIIKPNSHEEWLDVRKGGIGSSEIGTILGLNPYESAYKLWRRKRGIDAPKAENYYMKAGHFLEDAVSKFYADATGADIIKASAGDWIIRNNEMPFLQVSPDRTFWRAGDTHNNANKGILECKTTQRNIDPEDLPKYWYVQLMYQLGVAELDHGALAWLTGTGFNFGFKDIEFDPDLYAYIVENVERFWRDNIVGGIEPACACVDDVLTKFARHTDGKSIVVKEDIIEALEQLKECKSQIATLEAAKDSIEEAVKVLMGDAEMLVDVHGNTLATWKTAKDSQKFDTKRFQKEQPELYSQYIITTAGSRRFNVK